jgi:aminoglycoside phosphotransferase (APT) family kinase protein
MPEWTAELEVDEALARRLIREQLPSVAASSVRLLAHGWDNTVHLVDEAWAFRFPRRQVAVENLERERQILPHLVDLPLPIPMPVHAGWPSDSYPWPFVGMAFLRGSEVAEARLDDAARIRLGTALGGFLRDLHDPGRLNRVAAALRHDPMGRADMAVRVPRARQAIGRLAELGLWQAPASVQDWLDEAGTLGPSQATVVAHGDLHHRHVLVNERGEAAAVIDWGDVCRADPAIDLPLYWSLLSPAGREAMLRAYDRPVSAEQLLRARVLALGLAAVLAAYAHDQGMAALERESLAGLDRTAVP